MKTSLCRELAAENFRDAINERAELLANLSTQPVRSVVDYGGFVHCGVTEGICIWQPDADDDCVVCNGRRVLRGNGAECPVRVEVLRDADKKVVLRLLRKIMNMIEQEHGQGGKPINWETLPDF